MSRKIIAFICAIGVLASFSASARDELQGAWIASVFNINFPSKPGLSEKAQKAEIRNLLDAAEAAGLNAVFVQVRPEGDALYKSNLEPWSRYLTGTQGKDPGYDPLALFIKEGKKRNLQVHAWLNPFRAAALSKNKRTRNHISRRLPKCVRKVESILWMDPGAPEVRAHIVAVVKDIVSRYDVAGIHFDDYFYPYPVNGLSIKFPDDSTYAGYRKRGGKLSRSNWRRNNINSLIKAVSQTVRSTKKGTLFGVSPFGIYSKGQPPDVKAGVDQYKQLYSDPLTWMRSGWIDYLAPQLYWPDKGPQSFSSLLTWWRSPKNNPMYIPICPGIAVDRMKSHKWRSSEIDRQLKLESSIGPRIEGGFILWNIKALQENTKGVKTVIKKY